MDEKRAHATEIRETAERHQKARTQIDERAAPFDAYDRTVRPGPTGPAG
jgi:hypothetical protein